MNEAFNGFWNDLNAYYGKNQTNTMVIYEYEKEAQGVPASKKHDLFSYIVRQYDYFPKLSEFSRACARFKPEVKEREYNDRCVYCLGSGLIKYRRKIKELTYVPEYYAACVCDKGRSFKSNPVLGIEQVYGTKVDDVLKELETRNGGKHDILELKKSVIRSLDVMGMRSQGFMKQQASSSRPHENDLCKEKTP